MTVEDAEAGDDAETGQIEPESVEKISSPIEVGSITVGEDGMLTASDKQQDLAFGFVYFGIPFEAVLNRGEDVVLRLSANLGRLPFSAHSPRARQTMLRIIQATGSLPRAQIVVEEDHKMLVQAEATPPMPRNLSSIVATAAALLLEIRPYLHLLAEALSVSEGKAQQQNG